MKTRQATHWFRVVPPCAGGKRTGSGGGAERQRGGRPVSHHTRIMSVSLRAFCFEFSLMRFLSTSCKFGLA